MPIKISKKSKRTKKGKGKVSQSQQVIVNIQKGKRKASSQPVIRPSQAPIIIQPPQQDFSQLENLFKQYSTSRPVVETKPVSMGMDTQTDLTIPPDLEEKIKQDKEALQKKIEKLNEKKPVFIPESEITVPVKKGPVVIPLPVRANAPPPTPDKVYNPISGKMVTPAYYKKLVRTGKIKSE